MTASSSLRVRSRSSRIEIVQPWSFLCRSFVSCGLTFSRGLFESEFLFACFPLPIKEAVFFSFSELSAPLVIQINYAVFFG